MNNYCMHLKKRKNKPYCDLLNKEITFSQCRECDNKEYKNYIDRKKSGFRSKSPVKSGQINKNAQPLTKKPVKKAKMHNKSKKLTKLERNRASVFTDDLEHCYLCSKKKNDLHEIFGGRNRLNSIKYNFVLPLCRECHSLNQNNPFFNDYWHRQGQEYFECNIGNRKDFIKVFKKNYLK
ncbi:MAG: hypothetical protein ACI4VH_07470 [Clostridia bacterium]